MRNEVVNNADKLSKCGREIVFLHRAECSSSHILELLPQIFCIVTPGIFVLRIFIAVKTESKNNLR